MNDYLRLSTNLPEDITTYEKTILELMVLYFTEEELDELNNLYTSMDMTARESLTDKDLPPVSDRIYNKLQRIKSIISAIEGKR